MVDPQNQFNPKMNYIVLECIGWFRDTPTLRNLHMFSAAIGHSHTAGSPHITGWSRYSGKAWKLPLTRGERSEVSGPCGPAMNETYLKWSKLHT